MLLHIRMLGLVLVIRRWVLRGLETPADLKDVVLRLGVSNEVVNEARMRYRQGRDVEGMMEC